MHIETSLQDSAQFTFVPTETETASLQYMSKVTTRAAALKKAPELFKAKELVLSGQSLPKVVHRLVGADEIERRLAEMDDTIRPHKDAMRRAGERATGITEKITAIIKKGSIQTSVTGFDDPVSMRIFNDRLTQTIGRGEPVVMAMPEGGGKAPMSLKTGRFGGLPDFSEFLSHKMRAAMVQVLREVYSGGAHMITVPDAPLHTRDLGVCPVESGNHIRHLRTDLRRLGINKDEVLIADTPQLLPSNWFETVDDGALEVLTNMECDPVVHTSASDQLQSLLFIKNSTNVWESEEQAVLGYAAIAGSSDGIPARTVVLARDFERATWKATAMYMAINHHGIRGLGLIERAVSSLGFSPERYLRFSVHAKPGNPRPALSISKNNSAAPPALLPKHALGWRVLGDKPRWGLTFDLIARLHGWSAVHEAESGRFMYYEGAA